MEILCEFIKMFHYSMKYRKNFFYINFFIYDYANVGMVEKIFVKLFLS